MIHEIKTWPSQFEKILSMAKTHEVRKFDRPYKIGDTLRLREWNPTTQFHTRRFVDVIVTDITHPKSFGLPSGLCVMSVRREEEPRPQVMRLALEMERKLRLNEHKGGRETWLGTARAKLLNRLHDEVAELEKAVVQHGNGVEGSLDAMQAEAADIANFAMMIADDEKRDGSDKLDEIEMETKK